MGFLHLGHSILGGIGVRQKSHAAIIGASGAAIAINTFPAISELAKQGSHNSSSSA
jgi:hypothetical protein